MLFNTLFRTLDLLTNEKWTDVCDKVDSGYEI